MRHSYVFYFLLSFYGYASSLKCVSEWKQTTMKVTYYKKNRTTCEGDFCMNFIDAFGEVFDRDCSSNFHLKPGCWRESVYNNTACACNTENCNKVEMAEQTKRQPVQMVPIYKCHYYQYYVGEKVTEQELNYSDLGTFCSVEVSVGLDPSDTEVHIRRATVLSLPVRMNAANLMNFANYAHIGGIYAFTETSPYLHYLYHCRGDFCNRDFEIGWLEQRKDVICHNTAVTASAECRGEFCVFYTDPDGAFETESQACLTMNQTKAEGSYSVGIYKARSLTIYICKGDWCNHNATTAKKWIEESEKGIVSTVAPVTGTFTDKPSSSSRCSHFLSVLVLLFLFHSPFTFDGSWTSG